jgi:DNA-3-methyladenine glycosylase
MPARLDLSFFSRDGLITASELLGKVLVFNHYRGIIVENELYTGCDDPASHAFRGPTQRCQVMFGPGGMSYIYLIYGIYFCLNITAQPIGSPAAILLRHLWLFSPVQKMLDGPGKICRFLCLDKNHHNMDLTTHPTFYLTHGITFSDIEALPRVGIRRGQDKLWRFKGIDPSPKDFSDMMVA